MKQYISLLLFTTEACHLCEQALSLLQPWLQRGWSLREVDISESEELFQRYGLIIPVLRQEGSGRELHWPFDRDSIARFLAASSPPTEN
ncbi:MAG: glutaredoxin family protein [Gammaproteobacteria bacterium]|nr:glutaredoxin family protein [Gammaproteobacteria bacterium]